MDEKQKEKYGFKFALNSGEDLFDEGRREFFKRRVRVML
jgi:hypothetical protein